MHVQPDNTIKQQYSIFEFQRDMKMLCEEIQDKKWGLEYVYGLPRGGVVIALILSHKLGLQYLPTLDAPHNPTKTIIVDDISDTGKTLNAISCIKWYKTATLFLKPQTAFKPDIWQNEVPNNVWVEYWWEK